MTVQTEDAALKAFIEMQRELVGDPSTEEPPAPETDDDD